MGSPEELGGKFNRRNFLRVAGAFAINSTLPATGNAQKESNREIQEEYDRGFGIDDLTRPLIEDLTKIVEPLDRRLDLRELPSEMWERIHKYLSSYRTEVMMLGSAEWSRSIDAMALWYAAKAARETPRLDDRIPKALDGLTESALEQTVQEALSLMPPPSFNQGARDQRS